MNKPIEGKMYSAERKYHPETIIGILHFGGFTKKDLLIKENGSDMYSHIKVHTLKEEN